MAKKFLRSHLLVTPKCYQSIFIQITKVNKDLLTLVCSAFQLETRTDRRADKQFVINPPADPQRSSDCPPRSLHYFSPSPDVSLNPNAPSHPHLLFRKYAQEYYLSRTPTQNRINTPETRLGRIATYTQLAGYAPVRPFFPFVSTRKLSPALFLGLGIPVFLLFSSFSLYLSFFPLFFPIPSLRRKVRKRVNGGREKETERRKGNTGRIQRKRA